MKDMEFNVREYLEKICDYFDKDKAGERRLCLVYKIHDSGQNDGSWTVRIEDGICTLSEEDAGDCTLRMLMTAETYERMIHGRMMSVLAYLTGAVRYQGLMLAHEELQSCLTIPPDSGIIVL